MIPIEMKEEMQDDPYYKKCARKDSQCNGRITWEHALYYKGEKVQEKWAIVPLCWFHHLGFGMDKRINEGIALTRLFNNKKWLKDAKKKYPKAIDNWRNKYNYFNK